MIKINFEEQNNNSINKVKKNQRWQQTYTVWTKMIKIKF